jgi:hypothetical protein
MEELEYILEDCAQLSLQEKPQEWYNNTKYDVYAVKKYYDWYVYSNSYINEGDYIGRIEGERKYTWEVLPHKYCTWINDSYVIDSQEEPRCITAMFRQTYEEGLIPNCEVAFVYTSETIEVYAKAISPIYPGEELIIRKDMDEYNYY